jgi:glucosylceramidase
VEWVQTARFEDGKTALLAEMPALQMEHMTEPPTEKAIEIDSSKKYQTILGFGGAFTEASAINWRLLEPEDQAKVIDLYFNSAEEGGHAYTVGRVPINSCDFSPASYSFDDVAGDMELAKFDQAVQHDVDVGMIPMIKAAQAKIEARGEKLSLYGSPWSPPAWMKLPVGGLQNMTLSAKPNCLMPSMQRTWAKYFSKFIAAYRKHGIDMWGVTVQNEPEASVGWEACLWTPQFMAAFVRDHLGPVLEEEQPGVKIIGFDHNKDHVYIWAQQLYADPEAKKYFAGVGVHWYGGLNTHNLNDTHNLAPDKMILATEACNCGGVVYEKAAFAEGVVTRGNFQATWWSRAEALGLDILADLRYWAVGWTDWNLVLSTAGGPNHLKNLCDANIILDPKEELGMGKLIMQASYYYMGHFSRYIPAGSKRIHLKNTVEIQAPPLEAGDVKNGQALLFAPCDGNDVQKWQLSDDGSLIIPGTDEAKSSEGYQHGGECIDYDSKSWIEGRLQTYACAHSANQMWAVRSVPGGSQIYNPSTGLCVTAISSTGSAVGLDAGTTVTAAQLRECIPTGAANQTFLLSNYDAQGFPNAFPVRTTAGAPGGSELCLQPQIVRVPHFGAVAFEQPDKTIALVTMNIGDSPIQFTLVDKQARSGVKHLTLPSHAIHTYRWKPGKSPTLAAVTAAAAASPQQTLAVAGQQGSARSPAAVPTTCGVAVDTLHTRGAVGIAGAQTATKPATAAVGRGSVIGAALCAAIALVGALVVWPRMRRGGASAAAADWDACEVADDYQEYSTTGRARDEDAASAH